MTFRDTAFCHRCEQFCSITPRSDPDLSSIYWAEVMSLDCQPFSQCGAHTNWLDGSLLPAMVVLYSTRYYSPDSLLSENVPRFPVDLCTSILCSQSPAVLKSELARPDLLDADSEDEFDGTQRMEEFVQPYYALPVTSINSPRSTPSNRKFVLSKLG